MVAVLALYQLLRVGLKHFRRWWVKYKILNQLKNKEDEESMREAMIKCAEINGWSDNLSVRQWLQSWEQAYGENQLLRSVLLFQEQQQFGK